MGMTTQTLYQIDPQNVSGNASSTNSGYPGSPLLTVQQLFNAWAQNTPQLDQRVQIQFLSDDNPNDSVFAVPSFVRAGGLSMRGTLIQQQTATIGTFTPRNRAAGTPNKITAQGQSGAFWTPYVGMTVRDRTANAQFFIAQDLGSATAVITEPVQPPIPGYPTTYVTIANGDSLVIYRPSTIYGVYINSTGFGDGSGLGLQIYQLTLASGLIYVAGGQAQYAECCGSPTSLFETQNAYQNLVGPSFSSCWFPANAGGFTTFQGMGIFYSGGLNGAGPAFSNTTVLDGDVYIPLRVHFSNNSRVILGRVYFGQTPTIDTMPNQITISPQAYGDAILWGPAGFNAVDGTRVILQGVTATNALQLTGSLQLDGQSTGYPWNPSATPPGWGSAIAITPANIDAHGGLKNPLSGSEFLVGVG